MAKIGCEKFVNRTESAAGKKFFAGNARQALFQKSKKGNFAIGARRKIGRAAFGRSGAMAVAVPVEHRFAQVRFPRR